MSVERCWTSSTSTWPIRHKDDNCSCWSFNEYAFHVANYNCFFSVLMGLLITLLLLCLLLLLLLTHTARVVERWRSQWRCE